MSTLNIRYKPHSTYGSNTRKVQQATVYCPRFNRRVSVGAICAGGVKYTPRQSRGAHSKTRRCDFFGGFVLGGILCTHPRAKETW